MRKFYLSLVIILTYSSLALAQLRSGVAAELSMSEVELAMREQVAYLSSAMLEGRKAGSAGERMAAEYVCELLESYGIELIGGSGGENFGLKQEGGDTLVSQNAIGFIQGYDAALRDNYIVIGARLDNLGSLPIMVNGEQREKIYYGANGNASGLAMLMQLAKKLSTNSVLLRRSVIIAAFGASSQINAGSWYFVNRSFGATAKIDAMINLDMLGTGSNGFYAYTASNKDLNALIAELSGTLQPVHPKLVSMEPVASDHRSFYSKEIPSIFFTTGMYPEYNSEHDTASIIEYDWMERELEYIYNCTLELVNGKKMEFRSSDESGKKFSSDNNVYSYLDCETKPSFMGSADPGHFLKNWVYVYLRYPREAVQNGVQGRVLVDFIINEKGEVGDVRVIKGVSEALDAEAVRVISASPNWRPARMKGKKVKCEMSLYVDFKLEKRK